MVCISINGIRSISANGYGRLPICTSLSFATMPLPKSDMNPRTKVRNHFLAPATVTPSRPDDVHVLAIPFLDKIRNEMRQWACQTLRPNTANI